MSSAYGFVIRYMPGQEPSSETAADYQKRIAKLIADAAEGDPGEQGETEILDAKAQDMDL